MLRQAWYHDQPLLVQYGLRISPLFVRSAIQRKNLQLSFDSLHTKFLEQRLCLFPMCVHKTHICRCQKFNGIRDILPKQSEDWRNSSHWWMWSLKFVMPGSILRSYCKILTNFFVTILCYICLPAGLESSKGFNRLSSFFEFASLVCYYSTWGAYLLRSEASWGCPSGLFWLNISC